MDFWRSASNPWGQEVLVGISWDLMWLAAVAGVVFVIGHAIWVRRHLGGDATEIPPAPGVPEKVLRHSAGARAFHWLQAAAMFVLLVTAFFPVLGIQFPWVTIHWIAGVGLILTVVYHVIHATFWQSLRNMWIESREIAEGMGEVRGFFGGGRGTSRRPGKYPLDQKLYHHVIALVAMGAIGTGILMMFRVDTPFWARNPYLLSDTAWGWMYVIHGLCGVALITLVTAHVYFAIRPEKRWMTWSMINGWIGREDYLSHHDPERWSIDTEGSGPVGGGGASASLATEAAPQEKEDSP